MLLGSCSAVSLLPFLVVWVGFSRLGRMMVGPGSSTPAAHQMRPSPQQLKAAHLLLLFSLLSSCSLRMLRFCLFTSSSSLILPQRLPEHLYWTCSPQFALSVPPHLEPPGPLPLPCSPDYWSPCLLLGFRSACWFTTRYHWSECSWLFLTLFVTIENIKCTLKKQG